MKIKNMRAGILIIADAGMKLAPGDSVEVDTLTPQMESAAASKALVVMGAPKESKPLSRPATDRQETVTKDAEKLKEEVKPETVTPQEEVSSGQGALSEAIDVAGSSGKSESTVADDAGVKTSAPVAKTGGAKSGSK